MKITRLTLTLPATMKQSATMDSRVIAEAVGQALAQQDVQSGAHPQINLQGRGQTATHIAWHIPQAIKTSSRGGR